MKNRIITMLLAVVIFTAANVPPQSEASLSEVIHTDNSRLTAQSVSRRGSASFEPPVLKYGIDVSFWQGDIDWEKVARSGIEFVMLRAGRGAIDEDRPDIAEDERFREYIDGAHKNGLEVGVYFYSYAQTVREIRKEAGFLVNMLHEFRNMITYPVALDMEEERKHYKDNPSKMAEAFLEIITQEGYFPMMYSYKAWLEDYLESDVKEKYTMWVAQLDTPATTYRGNYYMWQYSHTGRVSGITGDVDLNIAYQR